MFVSVVVEPGSIDSGEAIVSILSQTGFVKVQKACWENMRVNDSVLKKLKKDLDAVTDYYDKIRFYQFPIDGMFVITELKQKKWKKCQLSGEKKKPLPNQKLNNKK